MAANLILFPFRLTVAGHVACAAQGTDPYLDSQVSVVIGTRLGERPMVPTFGIPDPTFSRLTAADVQTCVDLFGPDGLTVTGVTSTQVDDVTLAVDVTWARESEEL